MLDEQRMDWAAAAPGGLKALYGLQKYLAGCGLEKLLLDLVVLRASQMNGCAFCTDMHWKDSREAGAPERKLAMLTSWREAPFFTPRERAGLEWAEAVTKVDVPTELYARVRGEFSEEELANLTLAVGTIQVWNRLAISFRKAVPE